LWALAVCQLPKFVARAHRRGDLVDLGTLTPAAASFLDASVRAGLSIVVSGGTQAGKTTLLNCLSASIPGRERVVSCEEVFELRFAHPDRGADRAGDEARADQGRPPAQPADHVGVTAPGTAAT
jgi:Flp pilus assembly CpaF family ATPase